jgi:hypothetical protein
MRTQPEDRLHRRRTPLPIDVPAVLLHRVMDYEADDFIIDSGGSDHMVGDLSKLCDVQDLCAQVLLPDGGYLDIQKVGTMMVRFWDIYTQREHVLTFPNTLYVPTIRNPLIAVTRLAEDGHPCMFHRDHVEICYQSDAGEQEELHLDHPYYNTLPSGAAIVYNTQTLHEADTDSEPEHDPLTPSRIRKPRLNSESESIEMTYERSPNQRPPDSESSESQEAASNESQQFQVIPSTPRTAGRTVTVERMHNRLGHLGTMHIVSATLGKMWEDNIKVQFGRDRGCVSCKIGAMKSKNRGRRRLPSVYLTYAGQELHVDLIKNRSYRGLTPSDYHPYYLGIADAYSRAFFMVGMKRADVPSFCTALTYYAQYYKPTDGYDLTYLKRLHSDSGSIFTSKTFGKWCSSGGRSISVFTGAPHRPEMNGLCENRWQQVSHTTLNLIAHARLSDYFLDRAYIHASLLLNLHPHIHVFNEAGNQITPFEKYYGVKPNIARLRVFGCPVIFKVYTRNGGEYHAKNLPQRGVRGIWVGFPVNQAGALIWVNQTRQFVVSGDYHCDEDFISPLAYPGLPFHDAYRVRTASLHQLDPTQSVRYTGAPYTEPDPDTDDDPWGLYTALDLQHLVTPIPADQFYVTDNMIDARTGELDPAQAPPPTPVNINPSPEHLTPPESDEYPPFPEPDDPNFVIQLSLPPSYHSNRPTGTRDGHESPRRLRIDEPQPDRSPTGSPDSPPSSPDSPPHHESSDPATPPFTQQSARRQSDESARAPLVFEQDSPSSDVSEEPIDEFEEILARSRQQSMTELPVDSSPYDEEPAALPEFSAAPNDLTTMEEEEIEDNLADLEGTSQLITQVPQLPRRPITRSQRAAQLIEEGYTEDPSRLVTTYRTRAGRNAKRLRHDEYVYYAASSLARLPRLTNRAFAANVLSEASVRPPAIDDSGSSPAPFMPEPTCIRHLARLTPTVKAAWTKAFHKELRSLVITQRAVSLTDSPSPTDRVVPVKELFKCKLDQHGNIDKLKCRIVFRGDLYNPESPLDSWNPHATWFALKVFLALCARYRIFPSQTDFVSAYLQVAMKERVFIKFPDSWNDDLL